MLTQQDDSGALGQVRPRPDRPRQRTQERTCRHPSAVRDGQEDDVGRVGGYVDECDDVTKDQRLGWAGRCVCGGGGGGIFMGRMACSWYPGAVE
jgi:hypothetical protein